MQTLELFSGTKSFSKVAKEHGYSTLTIDNNPSLAPDLIIDIMNVDTYIFKSYLSDLDILWASPPCTAFSVASIGKHWSGGTKAYIPKSQTALEGLKLLDKTIHLIAINKPKKWYIENPRGVMRKVIEPMFKKHNLSFRRVTVTYCQYGDTRMKPTDIWTNDFEWNPKPACKNRATCHVSAPRGSKTGTQGLKGAKERGIIPSKLFKEIFS